MSFYNFISCEAKLPIPEEVLKEFPETKWDEVQFLNYDLYGLFSLEKFEISEDNLLYLRGEDGVIERQNITRSIVFWTSLSSNDYDYFLFFEALVFKGEAKEITFYKLEKVENAPRKQKEKALDEALEEYTRNQKKAQYKISLFFCSCAVFLLGLIRICLGGVMNLTFKMQKFLMKIFQINKGK